VLRIKGKLSKNASSDKDKDPVCSAPLQCTLETRKVVPSMERVTRLPFVPQITSRPLPKSSRTGRARG